MADIFHIVGVLGADLPVVLFSALILTLVYQGFRSERFLLWWIVFQVSQAVSIAGILLLVLYPQATSYPSYDWDAFSFFIFAIASVSPTVLLRGFIDLSSKRLRTNGQILIWLPALIEMLAFGVANFRDRDRAIFLLALPLDIAMLAVLGYIAIAGFRKRKTQILAAGCAMMFLNVVSRLFTFQGWSLRFIHHDPQTASAYLAKVLFQAMASGMITLGMLWLAVDRHREVTGSLDRALEELQEANAKLDHLVGLDPLTNIANRRAFEKSFALNMRRAVRSKKDLLALILFDVDKFKYLNDRAGHAAGDECLLRLASVLTSVFRREEDVVARIGGDEFAALLIGVTPEVAEELAENARARVEAETGCTVSIGWAITLPGPDDRPNLLFGVADQALYRAKHKGRNRIVRALATPQDSDRPSSANS